MVATFNQEQGTAESGRVETQNDDFTIIYGHTAPGENSKSRTVITERIIADRVRAEVDSVVAAIEKSKTRFWQR